MRPDEHPFIRMMDRHKALLDKLCRSFCGDSREDREDLRQEMLMNLWKGWKHWKPDHKPVTWIYRVAMNTAVSWQRERQRQPQTVALDGIEPPQDLAHKEAVEQLYSLIRRLQPEEQRLVQLYIEGWNYREIGKLMEMTETNVATRIGRIKQKLAFMNK